VTLDQLGRHLVIVMVLKQLESDGYGVRDVRMQL
jgi:hypothetical protein